jgi:hypothetical protein
VWPFLFLERYQSSLKAPTVLWDYQLLTLVPDERERERGIGKGLSLQVGASIDVDDEFVRISIRNRIDSFLHRSEMPLRCIQVHHYMPMSLRGGGFAPTLLLQQLQATVVSCWTRNCLLQIINRLTNNHI